MRLSAQNDLDQRLYFVAMNNFKVHGLTDTTLLMALCMVTVLLLYINRWAKFGVLAS